MAEGPVTLVVQAFDEESKADEVLKILKQLDKQGVFNIVNAAVLVRHENGKTSIKETEDVRAGRGALFGALAGGLIGLLGGPAGVIVGAAAGAATGGVAAGAIDMGFADKYLKDIEESLGPGTSAIIALVEHEWIERVIEELDQYEGQLFRQEIKAEIAAQLQTADSESKSEGES